MDDTIDKRTQLEHLRGCECLFKSLYEELNIQFDEEDGFKKSAKEFMDILDIKFPQQMTDLDKKRVRMILKTDQAHLAQMLDLQKVKENMRLATEGLEGIHHLLSNLKEGHDGLEEKLKRAVWLDEWLEARFQVRDWYNYIQEGIKDFNTKVDELTMSTGMTVTIQQCTVWILLEHCSTKLKELLKEYKVELIDKNHHCIDLFKNLYSVQTKEDPTSDVSTSYAASTAREIVIADLEKLKTSLDMLKGKLFRQRSLVILIKEKKWAGAAARDSYLKQKDEDIKGCISDFCQHSQELITLIQQEQAGK